MVSKGQFVGLDWNRITRLHSQVMIGTQEVKSSSNEYHVVVVSSSIYSLHNCLEIAFFSSHSDFIA